MTRHHLSKRLSARLPSVAALALLAAPSLGLAQNAGTGGASGSGGTGGSNAAAGNVNPRIVTIGGKSQDQLGDIFLNLEHCKANVDLELEVDGLPGDKDVLDLYVSTGTNCASPDSRDGDEDGNCVHLDGKAVDIQGRTQDVPVSLKVRDIVVAAFGTEDCGSRTSKPKLWFLAVNNEDGTDTVNANQYGTLELNVDTAPPNAPTSVDGGSGENEIPVNWSVGSSSVDSFEIYVDSGDGTIIGDASTEPVPSDDDGGTDSSPGATNSECGSGRLRAGGNAQDVLSLKKGEEDSATATSTTLSPRDIGGATAAVAVVALDEAGNRSPLSEVVCVSVVPTTGFKDAFEDENGEIPQGCPCAAAGPAQIEGALPIALALGLIAYRRRRRS